MSPKSAAGEARETTEIRLAARAITKVYPGTVALNKVNFNVYRGKVNALIGENGAGKSTLMKIIAGIEQPDEGSLYLDGAPIQLHNPREAVARGIGIIHQELNLFPNLTIAQNIFMGQEHKRHGFILDHQQHLAETADLLRRLEHPLDPNKLVSSLKVGEQQIVEIAKTMIQPHMNILIMDEPTSSLSNAEVEVLFKLIYDLKAQGISIVYISHRLEEITRISDYVTVLRDSRLVAEAPTANVDIAWIVRNMVGQSIARTVRRQKSPSDQEILKVEDLTLPREGGGYTLNRVSFSLRRGEILGIYGLLGSGRTELIETLMGLNPQYRGQLYLEGKKMAAQNIWEQIERGFAHIPEDRQREGLIQTLSIAKNISLASLGNYTRCFHLIREREEQSIAKIIAELGIKVADTKLQILSLSGGNQQKVVIGKGVLTDPKILLLDEPTRGIDIGAKADVFRIIDMLSDQGLAIILVASELKEIIGISDRIMVMSHGKITGEFAGEEIHEEALVKASAVGHEPFEK
jgi:ABC-type sugar transport system ATPase subunit